jgi:hypothetical protein
MADTPDPPPISLKVPTPKKRNTMNSREASQDYSSLLPFLDTPENEIPAGHETNPMTDSAGPFPVSVPSLSTSTTGPSNSPVLNFASSTSFVGSKRKRGKISAIHEVPGTFPKNYTHIVFTFNLN